MPLTGDYGTLQRWADRMGELGSASAMQSCALAMGHRHVAFVGTQFDREQDPFGNPWAAKKEPDGRKILHGASGKLQRFRITHSSSAGYSIGTAASYFKFHQKGTRKKDGGVRMVARRMLPGSKLPPVLASDFRQIYFRVSHARLKA
jgi:phage gpG-like protein